MSLKIELFDQIQFSKDESYRKKIVSNLKYLNSIRNKIAHGLGIVTLDKKFISGKSYRNIAINTKFMDMFREKASDTLASLQAILLYWAGMRAKDVRSSKLRWIGVDKIKGHFAEDPKFDPMQKLKDKKTSREK